MKPDIVSVLSAFGGVAFLAAGAYIIYAPLSLLVCGVFLLLVARADARRK